jgi:Protein of unknown function (DUF4019)
MTISRWQQLVFVLLVACAGFAVSAVADDGWRFPTDKITSEQWQTYRDETLALPGARSYEVADQLVVEVPQANAIYVFTTPSHPAHPAVVKREVVEKDGEVLLGRKGHYAGDREAYDRWWRQFDELDRRMREHVQNRSQAATVPTWKPSAQIQAEGERFLKDWMTLVDRQQYAAAYALLEPGLKEEMPQSQWEKFQRIFRAESGGPLTKTLRRYVWYDNPANAALPGIYLAAEYDAVFENGDRYFGVVILHKPDDGPFRVMRQEQNRIDKNVELTPAVPQQP